MTYGSEAAITSIATILIGTFGPIALATSNIVNQLAYIVYQLNIGLSQGSSILVSRHLGKGHIGEIRMVAKRSFTISFSIMAVIALIYILTPALVLSPFTNIHRDPAFMLIAATLLWFAIAHQFLKGSQNICIGLLRGLGNTNAGLTGTIIGYWLIGIPSMFICTYQTEWGVAGIWLSLCLGFAVTSILLWRRFLAQLHALENNALSL